MLALRSAPASSLRVLVARASPASTSHVRRYTSKPKSEPFKILFCGSDDFSVAILRELLAAEGASTSLLLRYQLHMSLLTS